MAVALCARMPAKSTTCLRNSSRIEEEASDQGNYIKVLALPDGNFTVENSRNHLTKDYVH